MQSPFAAVARTGFAGNAMRSARLVVLAATFVLLAFSSAAAQPLTDSHRGRDLPAGHVSYSTWDIVKEGHRYRFLLADGRITTATAPAVERRHRALA